MSKYAPGLVSEPPIVVYPSLAVKIGINAAIILQQLHFLIANTKDKNNTYNHVEKEWWVYNSYSQWRESYFPWLSERTIQNVFLELEKEGVVKSMQSVKSKADRRKWYTIDYEAWYIFFGSQGDHDTKNVPSDDTKNVQSESETTTETTEKILASPDGNAQTVLQTDAELYGESVIEAGDLIPVAAAQQDEKPKKERQPNPWYDAVKEVFCIEGGWNGDMQKLLRGESRRKGYKEYNLPKPITPEQLLEWGKWWKIQNAGLSITTTPKKIQSSIMFWQSINSPACPKPKPWGGLEPIRRYGTTSNG